MVGGQFLTLDAPAFNNAQVAPRRCTQSKARHSENGINCRNMVPN